MTQRFITNSPAETAALAEQLAPGFAPGSAVALFGGLGGGKTTFVAAALRALGVGQQAASPTYAIVNEYVGAGGRRFAHFDMYRIETEQDLLSCGYYEALDSGATLFIEWSENIEPALPNDAVRLIFSRGERDDQRIIELKQEGAL